MSDRIAITYGEFYDFPRMVEFQVGGQWFFMRSFFDEDQDEYSDSYEVYLLPFHSEAEVKAHPDYWLQLDSALHLGKIPISQVGLDATRRQSLDAGRIGPWLAAQMEKVR